MKLAVLNVAILSIFFYVAIIMVGKIDNIKVTRLSQYIFLVLLLIPLNHLRYLMGINTVLAMKYLGGVGLLFGVLVTVSILARGMFLFGREITSSLVTVVCMMMPYALLNIYQVGVLSFHDEPGYENKPTKSIDVNRSVQAKKVVWVIFDEMDMRLTFLQRPEGLELPELDRLRHEALFSTNAYPPSRETLRSLPALLTGRLIRKSEPLGTDELMISFDKEKEAVRWSAQETVFSNVQKMGLNTALVGFYHPYGRILNKDLNVCDWQPLYGYTSDPADNIAEKMMKQYREVLNISYGHPLFGKKVEIVNHISNYQKVLSTSRKMVIDKRIGLVFLHIPLPHEPFIYERSTRKLRYSSSDEGSYFDNLALADYTLGILRHDMEISGTWEDTTVIISSDHWWRESERYDGKIDHRVPFIVKLAGQRTPLGHNTHFNTVLTRGLVLGILTGDISSPSEVAGWINKNRSTGPSPYY